MLLTAGAFLTGLFSEMEQRAAYGRAGLGAPSAGWTAPLPAPYPRDEALASREAGGSGGAGLASDACDVDHIDL